MQVNRYTNTQPARYTPRTLQELMVAPSYMREQHNQLDESRGALEASLAQVDPLAVHSDLAKQKQQELYGQMNKQAEQLATKGFTPTSKSDFIRLNKQYQQAVSPTGDLGKIQAAKKAMEANKASYIANATKLGYAADAIAANWGDEEQKYADEFAKTGQVTNISERYSPNYINVTDKLTDLFSKAGATASELGTLTSSVITNDPKNPGQYILTKSAKEAHSSNIANLQAAVDYVNTQISNPDSEIGRSLKEQRKTPAQALQEVEGLNKVFEKTSTSTQTASQMSGYKSPTELGVKTSSNTPLQYEYEPDSTVEVYSKAVINKLDNILGKVPHITGGGPKMKMSGTGLNMSGSIPAGKYETTTEPSSITNQLNTEERTEYDKIFNNLQQNNQELQGISPYSVQGVKAVRDYYNNNKSIQRQDIVITDDFVKVYGDRSVGTEGTNRSKIAEDVKANPETRRYFIEGSDRAVSYGDLPTEIKQNFDKVTYSGYYSPKNFMTEKYGQEQDKTLFVSPLKMQYRNENGDLTTMMVSRSATELNSPEYAADAKFNDVFINTNRLPDIPYAIPNRDGSPSSTEVAYLSNKVVQNGKVCSYVVNTKLPDGSYGTPILVTEDELQSSFYTLNKVPTTDQKKKK